MEKENTCKSNRSQLSYKEYDEATGVITDHVDLKMLPEFRLLSTQVEKVVDSSSWWELYGVDWAIHICMFIGWLASFHLLGCSSLPVFVLGILTLGYCHTSLTVKIGHAAVHKSVSTSAVVNRLVSFLVSDFIGTFSADAGYNIHIKVHHPYTNVIGLGDSSSFKSPVSMPGFVYMFFAPLLSPFLIPYVALKEMSDQPFLKLLRHIIIAYFGLAIQICLLMTISNLSLTWALAVLFLSRNVLTIPYIHVNIFQHIGLPMYSLQHKPKRIYQMTTGVLNLPRNPILDYAFGHSIMSCHVSHHLFPRLSDNMCLKVEPVIKKFCQEHGLPYHCDTYTNRTWEFVTDYHRLMENAPPITKFVGLQ